MESSPISYGMGLNLAKKPELFRLLNFHANAARTKTLSHVGTIQHKSGIPNIKAYPPTS